MSKTFGQSTKESYRDDIETSKKLKLSTELMSGWMIIHIVNLLEWVF